MQSKYIRFCLQLGRGGNIGIKGFEQINWLPICEKFNEYISSDAFKLF